MARIDIKSAGSTLNDGVLQLENGVAMDATLRNVADQNNTTSPLKLSTTAVQVVSPLRVTTDDPSDMYLDLEDGSANNRFNITRNTASQQVNLNFASNPAGSTTTVGAIRTFTDGVNLGEVVKFREDGQVTFTERVNVEADSLVTTQSSSVIAATTTNASLVIAPNGTGALVASIPDGTATGGNARGQYAVDLQTSRTASSQVASGNYSSIIGGIVNTASGAYSIAGGAFANATAEQSIALGSGQASASGAVAIGGLQGGGNRPIASGSYAVAFSLGNTASSSFSTVSGGQSNTASTNTHATVVGGQSNTSSGQGAVSGGLSNTASGLGSVALAYQNTASGNYSVAAGFQSASTKLGSVAMGIIANATGDYSTAFGARSNSYLYGQLSFANDTFTGTGNSQAQQSYLTARRESTLTTGATTVLSLDGTGTTNLIIPTGTNRMWNVQVRWVAVVTTITGTATGVTVGDTKTSTDLLAVAKRAGTTTVSAHTSAGTHAIETIAGSLTAANITYSAGASQEMAITFTGPTFAGGGSVTMRVVAAISLTEVSY
jgi:hypothetical protein